MSFTTQLIVIVKVVVVFFMLPKAICKPKEKFGAVDSSEWRFCCCCCCCLPIHLGCLTQHIMVSAFKPLSWLTIELDKLKDALSFYVLPVQYNGIKSFLFSSFGTSNVVKNCLCMRLHSAFFLFSLLDEDTTTTSNNKEQWTNKHTKNAEQSCHWESILINDAYTKLTSA